MKKKVIFLDIDGTLIGYDGKMPESTKGAIRQAVANGHHLVICSGRSKFQVDPSFFELGFQGVVGAAGAYVEINGTEIYHSYIEELQRKFLCEYLESNGFIYCMQADHGIVINESSKAGMIQIFSGMGISEKRLNRLIGNMEVREDVWNHPKEEKALFFNSPFSLEKVNADIAPYFTAISSSMQKKENKSGEIGIAGINKATGMQIYLDHLGIAKEDTIAIGDGPNDMEMIAYAEVGIAMGNAHSLLKEIADITTREIDRDGIKHAFEVLGII